DSLGGECLWTGCVPTKALVASARLAHSMRHASRLGFEDHDPPIDAARIMESMRETQRITAHHDDPEKFRDLGIEVIFGEARVEGPGRVHVGERILGARDTVIATGSRTRLPRIDGLEAAGWTDHVSFLSQDRFPSSIAIVGGGAIACEFAQLLGRFGSRVTLIHRGSELLKREDLDVREAMSALLRGEGVEIRFGTTVDRVERQGSGRRLHLVAGEQRSTIDVEELFIATGRQGNVENLGLEEAGVRVKDGFIITDETLRTTAPRIWACGDVHGRLLFTHAAAFEAVSLVRNILFPLPRPISYEHLPWSIFTDPELARVGMTEEEARGAIGADDVRVWRTEMKEVDRAVADRATGGFLKIVGDRKGKILGAHLFCSQASSLIGSLVLARKRGAGAGDLARMVSPYPSMGDAIGKAGALYYQELAASGAGTLARMVASWTHR
ncbi:MAG TPA: FAD-dependent oxidoreductase, partial [Thermoanaerobaculia bacterium]|nr:FAD-dependent oxidoreductase [Thermoanaerobaculia bacterium]